MRVLTAAGRHRRLLALLVIAPLGLVSALAATKAPRAAGHAPPRAAATLTAAGDDQLAAARLVYYGHYDCELKQTLDVAADDQHAGYVAVRSGRTRYVMKPVLSSTGALRLEDVKGQTLMVQIAGKSMLLDVKHGHRLVDDCMSAPQREWTARAKADEAAARAAEAASAAAAAAQSAASAASAAGVAAGAATAAAQSAASSPAADSSTSAAAPLR